MESMDRVYEHGSVTMAFTDFPGPGTPGAPTFVLVHGIGMGRVVFAGVSEVLAQYGRVLAVDLPGFGDSPEPGSSSPLEVTAAVVADFIRTEDAGSGPLVLVGHSMGTQIVAELSLQFRALVDHLLLIAPTVNRHERTARMQAARMVQDLFGEVPKVLLLGLWEYAKTSPLWFINKLRFMLGHRLEAICPIITTPTLVIRGEVDRVCPRDWVTEIADALPNSRMEEIPDRGHEAIIRSPEPVASMILDFVGVRASGSHS